MKKLKNGLWIKFEWDDRTDLPMLIVSDTEDITVGSVWHFNLNFWTVDKAFEEVFKHIGSKKSTNE